MVNENEIVRFRQFFVAFLGNLNSNTEIHTLFPHILVSALE